jgi:peptidoglycan/LPS O-acetylase OafA/YrhL
MQMTPSNYLQPSITSATRPRFPALDGLRALAALSVLAFHVEQNGHGNLGVAKTVVGHLNSGVVVFFLLSGFVLYRPFVSATRDGRAVPLRGYFIRRFMRIVPAYWLALLVLSIWPGLPGFGHSWPALMSFLQVYSPHWQGDGLVVAWSLCTEVTFYLALPIYAALVSRIGRGSDGRRQPTIEIVCLGAIAIGSLGLHSVISATGSGAVGLDASLPCTAYLFVGGMLLAVCSVHGHALLSRALVRIGQHRALCWVSAFVLMLAIAYRPGAHELGPTNPLYVPVAFFLLMPFTMAPDATARLDRTLAKGPLAFLGLISYGIYLWHDPLLAEIAPVVGKAGDGLIAFAVTAAAAIAAASASYFLLERHAQRLGRRFDRAHAATAPEVIAAEGAAA